jgi:hypothetical protein
MVPIVNLSFPPNYIIVLHRLARLGLADRYVPRMSVCQFDMEERSKLMEKWPDFDNVSRVTLLYRRDK